jgi:hypothetical protein
MKANKQCEIQSQHTATWSRRISCNCFKIQASSAPCPHVSGTHALMHAWLFTAMAEGSRHSARSRWPLLLPCHERTAQHAWDFPSFLPTATASSAASTITGILMALFHITMSVLLGWCMVWPRLSVPPQSWALLHAPATPWGSRKRLKAPQASATEKRDTLFATSTTAVPANKAHTAVPWRREFIPRGSANSEGVMSEMRKRERWTKCGGTSSRIGQSCAQMQRFPAGIACRMRRFRQK